MATNISALQPSGQTLVLEVTPETTGRELKQQIKQGQPWDKLTQSTTSVEIIVRDTHLLANDEKVLDARIAEDTVVSVVFKPNKVICSNKDAIATLGGIIDSKLLLVVEIPHDEMHILEGAFKGCETLAKVIIPDSVTHIGELCLCELYSFGQLDHSKLSDPHQLWCLSVLQFFGQLGHSRLSDLHCAACLWFLPVFVELDHP